MDLPVGTVLGEHYRITRLIGVGGMGAIYEASHMGAGKRVAVKLMSKELAAHPEALARFRREVKVTTELAHPHIVDVFDFGESPTGEPFLVMEFLDGEDLGHRLEREGRLPLAAAVQIVKQVASALSVAHAEGVVHRDLKPDNVFLLRVADGGVFVKVVDFGISKVLKATTTKLTVARAVVGTPEFMAPEQASGRIDWIDHRTDQWALAVLAWHMLSGRLPFWKPEVNLILNQVIQRGADAAAPGPGAADPARGGQGAAARAVEEARGSLPDDQRVRARVRGGGHGQAGAVSRGARCPAGTAASSRSSDSSGRSAAPAREEPRRPVAVGRRAGTGAGGGGLGVPRRAADSQVVARRNDDARRAPRGRPDRRTGHRRSDGDRPRRRAAAAAQRRSLTLAARGRSKGFALVCDPVPSPACGRGLG